MMRLPKNQNAFDAFSKVNIGLNKEISTGDACKLHVNFFRVLKILLIRSRKNLLPQGHVPLHWPSLAFIIIRHYYSLLFLVISLIYF